MVLHRAYSLIDVKSVDDDQRVITGIATTPEPDRMGDVVEPDGAKFTLPIPLLWQHRSDQPIGQVIAAKVTKAGIEIKAQIARAGLLSRIDESWALMKEGLVKGLSIGFRATEDPEPIKGSWGVRFHAWELLELSVVTIAANASASIQAIKSIDAQDRAASGAGPRPVQVLSPGVTGTPVASRRRETNVNKTITERIADFEAKRAANVARMNEIQEKAAEEGRSKDEAEKEEFETLKAEVKSVDDELVDLREMQQLNKAAAVEVKGATPAEAQPSRAGASYVSVRANAEPGIEFTRAVLCKVHAFTECMKGNFLSAEHVAKSRFPDNQRIQQYVKAAVPAGTTSEAVWASPLVDPTNLAGEFVEFLRPQTIIGKFGANGIPSLRRIPFNVRYIGQTNGGNGYWVGQGAPKPLTSFAFEATTLTWAKVAAISVITEELARFSSPSAEMLVRDGIAAALIERIDTDFVDPAKAVSTGVSPASITNGLTALSSAGTSADNARTDVQNLLEQFILNNINPTSLVLIMPNTLALALSLLRNSLGQKEFNDITMNGGRLEGIPVITSQYAANQSGYGNMVIAVNASDVFLSDDGQVTVDASREASLQMLDNPTNNSSSATATTMVSMWQTNSIALRAERFINWAKRRDEAVVYMDDVNWGSIGSPS